MNSSLNRNRQVCYRAILLLGLLPLASCIASKPSSGGQQQQIIVTVTPNPMYVAVSTVAQASTQPFAATVIGTTNTAVTWSLAAGSGCSLSGAGLGSIAVTSSNTMTYTAPMTVPVSPCPVIVTALSSADNATTGQALANVHIIVTINGTPGTSYLAPDTFGQGSNWQYQATVTGSTNPNANQTVTWLANGEPGGTIDPATGFYVAPQLSGSAPVTASITATSSLDTFWPATANITIQPTDPLGAVSSYSTLPSCSGYNLLPNATCYQLNVTCPGTADITTFLKVSNPAGSALGTVLFGTGTGGSGLYDDTNTYTYGHETVEGILNATGAPSNAGYNTVQISFGSPFNSTQPNGWLQGPGGVRRLACRYATVASWVYNHPAIINPSATGATNSAPMCSTGNSGGSAAIGYAVYEYGLAGDFVMIEPTSGPVTTRIDLGCSPCSTNAAFEGPVCTDASSMNNPEMCYTTGGAGGDGTAGVIDAAYQAPNATTPTLCTDAVNNNPDPDAASRFLSDSILYGPSLTVPLPNTIVNQVFADDDTSNAVPQGMLWGEKLISPSSPSPKFECLASPVMHDIPSYATGEQQIVTEITTLCK